MRSRSLLLLLGGCLLVSTGVSCTQGIAVATVRPSVHRLMPDCNRSALVMAVPAPPPPASGLASILFRFFEQAPHTVSLDEMRNLAEDFVRYRYPGATHEFRPEEDGLVAVVSGLKNEIISSYWERLEVSFDFYYTQEGDPKVKVRLTGGYAAGRRQPKLSSYQAFGAEKSDKLKSYAWDLVKKFKTWAESEGPVGKSNS